MSLRRPIDRRRFLQTTGGAALAASAPAIRTSAKTRRDKPNLLVLWTDEQRADTMEAYGNRAIKTPNLNRLGRESVVVENAYVSQPVCTPSRSTVLTGLWPHSNGCVTNNIPLSTDFPCLPKLLEDDDYRSGYFGKWHLGDEIYAQHGFEEWVSIEDGYTKYYREGRDRTQKSTYHHFLDELGYEPDTSAGTYSRGFAAHRKLEHCKPKFLERKTCDFLHRHRDEPFALYVNFLEPHMPFYGPLNHLHDPDEIDLPTNYADPLEEDEPLSYRLRRAYYKKRGFQELDLDTEAGWRRLIANYLGLCSQVDLSVGAILATLEREGLAENTIVVYTSDHGDMMGSHQMVAKGVMYEEATRVPWLMRIPQQGMRKQQLKGSFSHIDLVPTLLDLMGKPTNESLPGRSLTDVMKGERADPDDVFLEWNIGNPNPSKMTEQLPATMRDEAARAARSLTRTVVSRDRWKLCLNTQDKNQLFNLNEDPGETTNLFYSGQYGKRIAEMTRRIHQWQERVQDTVEVCSISQK